MTAPFACLAIFPVSKMISFPRMATVSFFSFIDSPNNIKKKSADHPALFVRRNLLA
jgi:hypothetical protein